MDENNLKIGNIRPPSGNQLSGQGNGEICPSDDEHKKERRTSPRNHVLKPAAIKFDHNFANVPCVIRNLSEIGALGEIATEFEIPQHFAMRIPMNEYEVNCQITWRNGRQIGIGFVSGKRQTSSKKIQYVKATSASTNRISSRNCITGNTAPLLDRLKTQPGPTRLSSTEKTSFGKRK
ncbi:MAG: hypothetical protein GY742_10645 [Hyphomicrobiales bacterium]|nr:hypothetical protein [Hyphomicrobiales bacterium]